jgi:hypothetical protein
MGSGDEEKECGEMVRIRDLEDLQPVRRTDEKDGGEG